MIQTSLQYLRALIVEAGVIPRSFGTSTVEKNSAESPKEAFAAVGVLETR